MLLSRLLLLHLLLLIHSLQHLFRNLSLLRLHHVLGLVVHRLRRSCHSHHVLPRRHMAMILPLLRDRLWLRPRMLLMDVNLLLLGWVKVSKHLLLLLLLLLSSSHLHSHKLLLTRCIVLVLLRLRKLVLLLLSVELVSHTVRIHPLMILLRLLLLLLLLLKLPLSLIPQRTTIHLVMILLLLLAREARLPRRQRASVCHIRRVCISL